MRVLHVLHHSVPYLDGYCIRSKQIVDFERCIGLDVRVLTSAQHEVEVERAPGARPEPERIDGVTYYRTPLPDGSISRASRRTPFAREGSMMTALARSLRRVLAREKVDLIHTHSPVLCGLPAVMIASQRRIPMVYEVRGFWEDGFVGGRWSSEHALRYKIARRLETLVFRRANAVIAISQHMLSDIETRGIPSGKLHLVPNGVDTTRFAPIAKDSALLDKHRLRGRPVVGFIGSFYQFEGLESLLESMTHVRRQLPEARLLLVGGGEQEALIPRRVRDLGLDNEVIVTGRVPHSQIAGYYSVMDVLVYPRLRNRTTDLTTPLKPLEAMAMGKTVLGSDVGGIRELLANGAVGTLFEAGDSRQLADRIVCLLTDGASRERLAEKGRDYVLRERGWDRLVLKYQDLYRSLVASPKPHATR
jgi:PEP-CTERM/exosortase A-associated glycosyltransferase